MYYVYVLENDEGKHYMGSCENPELRFKRHNQNSVRSTKHKGRFKIIYKEECCTKIDAQKRENELKGYKGNSVFKRIIDPVV